MEDELIEILESFGYPVFRQGSMSEYAKYPDNFFTFWNTDSYCRYYNNREYETEWDYDVNFYSIDPSNTYSVLASARSKLKERNWIVPGKGYDVTSDETTHTGRGMEVIYLQK